MNYINYDGGDLEELLSKNEHTLMLVSTEWCGPCKMLKPSYEKFSQEFENIQFVKVDRDFHADKVVEKYEIAGVPTMILFKNGKQVDKKVGFAPEPVFRQWLEFSVK